MKVNYGLAELFDNTLRFRRVGEVQRAIQCCQQMLALAPRHPDVHHLLGLIYSEQGEQSHAERHLRRAITARDSVAEYHYNLGEVLRRQGKLAQAEHSYRKALRLEPRLVQAHIKLGNLLNELDRLDESAGHYQQASLLKPEEADTHYKLGNTLRVMGAYEAAIPCYQRVLQLRPDFADAHNDLGVALMATREVTKAIRSFQRALECEPDFVSAQKNMGLALEKDGQIEIARDCYQKALALAPEDGSLKLHAESLCAAIPNSNEEIDVYRANLMAQLEKSCKQGGLRPNVAHLHVSTATPPNPLIYQGRDDRPLKEAWAELFRGHFPDLLPKQDNKGKPHVGFVVTRNHEGVFLKAMRGVLNHLTSRNFRWTVVCSQRRGEQLLRAGIHNSAVRYLPLPVGFEQSLHAIRQARFHLLYYWEVGTDSVNYFLPFFRLAPIQCTGWGWPVTSGIPQMDYYLSSQHLETEESDLHYTERLVRLRKLPSYFYRPEMPALVQSREYFGLPSARHLYLCVQNLLKIHPDFDPLLAGILRRDPQGEVLLVEDAHPAVTAQLRRRLRHTLPEVIDRIRFLPRVPADEYLARLALADVMLDPPHYVGGTTTYDAMVTGVPVVTLPTRFHRGRFTYAAYRQMGLDEGIATDLDDYVERALRFANEPDHRADVSTRLRDASPTLFEDQEAVRELEAFFQSVLSG